MDNWLRGVRGKYLCGCNKEYYTEIYLVVYFKLVVLGKPYLKNRLTILRLTVIHIFDANLHWKLILFVNLRNNIREQVVMKVNDIAQYLLVKV